MTLEEPPDYGEDTKPTKEEVEEAEIRTDHDPESDSDEEQIVESVAEGQTRRYPLRERRPPRRFSDAEHVLLTDEGETKSFEEAKDDTHNCKWLSAMQDEMDSLHENHTYKLVELPKGKCWGRRPSTRKIPQHSLMLKNLRIGEAKQNTHTERERERHK